MKATTKKIASLSFILLGFVPLLFVLIITIEKHEIRHRMKKELQRQELQTIILSEKEVVWMDKHEIWVNDQMFDIHSKALKGDVYTFTGLYDEEETLLVEKEKNAAGNADEQNKLLSQLFKSLPAFSTQQTEHAGYRQGLDHYNIILSASLVCQFREILTPPPQL